MQASRSFPWGRRARSLGRREGFERRDEAVGAGTCQHTKGRAKEDAPPDLLLVLRNDLDGGEEGCARSFSMCVGELRIDVHLA